MKMYVWLEKMLYICIVVEANEHSKRSAFFVYIFGGDVNDEDMMKYS